MLDSPNSKVIIPLTGQTKVIVIDPEREYKQLTDSLKGTYIKLSAKSKEKINPFDFSVGSHGDGNLAEHIQDLTEIISLMVDGLAVQESVPVKKNENIKLFGSRFRGFHSYLTMGRGINIPVAVIVTFPSLIYKGIEVKEIIRRAIISVLFKNILSLQARTTSYINMPLTID